MTCYLIPILVLLAACTTSAAQPQQSKSTHAATSKGVGVPDPIASDGDKYRVVLENEQVRVLRYHDEPGQKTHQHHHPNPFVMYALAPFQRELIFSDGHHVKRNFRADEAAWMQEQTHIGNNVGDVPTDVLLIEVKACADK